MRARRAEPRDVEAICRVCSEGWRETYAGLYDADEIERTIERFYSRDRVRSEVEQPEGWDGWWVAEDEAGEVVAAGGGGVTAPAAGEIFVLYADPARRGRGAGTALLEAISSEQRAQDVREQWVSVEPENASGIAFYRARGFVERGTGPAYEAPHRLSLRMSRPL